MYHATKTQKTRFDYGPLILSLGLLISGIASSQPNAEIHEDTTTFLMKEGIKRTRIISKLSDTKNELIATLFAVEDTSLCDFGIISRKNFSGTFSFEGIEKMCTQNGEELVLQVAGAFTPDWKVIEGYALEKGESVGQDHFLGENKKIDYRGLCIIKDGHPHITNLDVVYDMPELLLSAHDLKWTLFQQVSAIIDGKPAKDIVLPREAKRRFLVEVGQESQSKFGIISFIQATSYEQAVNVLLEMSDMNLPVLNALYLDMGSVSEGYFYDSNNMKHLLGDKNDNIDRYTNMLVIYRKAEVGPNTQESEAPQD
jgi:hypothetical protein